MMKILYKPTKQVMLVADEEALEIMKRDKANNYQIVGAGFREDAKITEEDSEIKEQTTEDEDDDLEDDSKGTSKPLEEFTLQELRVLCKKLGLFASRSNKATCIKMIREYESKED